MPLTELVDVEPVKGAGYKLRGGVSNLMQEVKDCPRTDKLDKGSASQCYKVK